jgi:hypothetical protein
MKRAEGALSPPNGEAPHLAADWYLKGEEQGSPTETSFDSAASSADSITQGGDLLGFGAPCSTQVEGPPALIHALRWRELGAFCIAVHPRDKRPVGDGWEKSRLGAEELRARLTKDSNLGLLLGEPSGGIVDVDLDCPEAVVLADTFLPPTECIFGREGNPRTHRLYRAAPCPEKTCRLQDPRRSGGKATLLELRSSGGQTVIPPSIYPEGERCVYTVGGVPSDVAGGVLERQVRRLAAACLLARYWPGEGARHDAALALAGGLLRGGRAVSEAEGFIRAVATAAHDDEVDNRIAGVATTAARLQKGETVVGWPRLAELVDRKLVSRVCGWLDLVADLAAPRHPAVEEDPDEGGAHHSGKLSQGTILYKLAAQRVDELFHDANGGLYALMPVDGHREVVAVSERGGGVTDWLTRLYYEHTGRAPSSTGISDALRTLVAYARKGQERQVHLRVGEHDGRVYLDLCQLDWRVVEVDGEGWRVVTESPLSFCRTKELRPLPLPERGGNLDSLGSLFPQADEEGRILLTAWLLAALLPAGPYPILALYGEQGSGKTTAAKVARFLVDPSGGDGRGLVGPPKDEDDLVAHALRHRVVAYDNLSSIRPPLSDALCRLATGAGLSKRRLYTDNEEALVHVCRPIILNGISAVAERPDLIDRCFVVNLAELPAREDEVAFWSKVEELRPLLLGALLDALSAAVRGAQSVSLPANLRMVDAAKWVVAAEPALPWPPGRFVEVYAANRRGAVEVAVDASPLPGVLERLLADRLEWEGTATQLLEALNPLAGSLRDRKDWPCDAARLSAKLNLLAPALRTSGRLDLRPRKLEGRALWRIRRVGAPVG